MQVLTIGAALCVILAAPGQQYATDYSPGSALRVEWESEVSLETTDFEVLLDGEVMDTEGFGDRSSTEERHAVWVDTVLEAKDGRPTRLTRTFESLAGGSTMLFGDRERSQESECPLEELTLELGIDEDGDVVTEVTDGVEPDDESLLEGHRLALPFDVFLPEGEVGETDEWKLDGDAIREGLLADLDAKLFPRPPRPERGEDGGRPGRGGRSDGDGMQRGQRGGRGMGGSSIGLMFSEGEWTGEARLAGAKEDHEGVECAVIELELECKGSLPERERGERGGGEGGGDRSLSAAGPARLPRFENSFSIELEGKLYYSIADKRPVAFTLEGEVETESTRIRERGESVMEMRSAEAGDLRYTATIGPAEKEDLEEAPAAEEAGD